MALAVGVAARRFVSVRETLFLRDAHGHTAVVQCTGHGAHGAASGPDRARPRQSSGSRALPRRPPRTASPLLHCTAFS